MNMQATRSGSLFFSGKGNAPLIALRDLIRREEIGRPFRIHPEVYQHMEAVATEQQATPILSTAGGLPQNEPSALQDIDMHTDGYSAGLSGRLA